MDTEKTYTESLKESNLAPLPSKESFQCSEFLNDITGKVNNMDRLKPKLSDPVHMSKSPYQQSLFTSGIKFHHKSYNPLGHKLPLCGIYDFRLVTNYYSG